MEGRGGEPYVSDQPTPSDEQFAATAEALLRAPGVTYGAERKRAFGSNALKVNGNIFAMLVSDALVVKLPRQRIDTLIADGVGERYDPRHNGRLMKEWITIDPDSDTDWLALAREALAFVATNR